MRSESDSKRSQILDAAEECLVGAGYDSVSLRQIAKAGGVPLGLVSYYFPSKEQLFSAVLERRAGLLSERRTLALKRALERAEVSVEDIVDAFIGPWFEMILQGDPGWQRYGRIIAQTLQDRRWSQLTSKHWDETGWLFIDALVERAGVDPEGAVRGLVYAVSAMTGAFSMNRRLETLSRGVYSSDDLLREYRHMLPFLAAGFRAFTRTSKP